MTWRQKRRIALDYLRSIYRWEPESGVYTIDVRLPDYSHAFSQWSHAWEEVPEVDPGLVQYLKECSDDIPFAAPISIVFGIRQPRDYQLESQLIESVRKYFRYELFIERRRLRRLLQRVASLVALALVLLAASSFFSAFTSGRLLAATANQGLTVGGWVFLWEAIHQLSFQRSTIRRTIADYERFLSAQIGFESPGTN